MDKFPATLHLPKNSAGEGAALHITRWLTEENPRGIILISHGYAEHAARYAPLASQFNAAGFSVYAVDHWGHGRSAGIAGYVPDFSVYLAGIHGLVARVKREQGDCPRILLGHSMGGLIAAHYLIRAQGQFVGAALSGPALAPAQPPSKFLRVISGFLSRKLPKIGVMSLDGDAVSRDPAVVGRYRSDPLVYRGKVRARLAHEMLKAMDAAREGAAQIRLPMLIQHGGADRLTSPEGSEDFFRALASPDKQIRIYDGLYHEIYNEPECQTVIHDLIHWCEGACHRTAPDTEI